MEVGRVLDASAFGLGEWSLSPHHVYNQATGQLMRGDGISRDVRHLGKIVTELSDEEATGIAVDDTGSVIYSSSDKLKIISKDKKDDADYCLCEKGSDSDKWELLFSSINLDSDKGMPKKTDGEFNDFYMNTKTGTIYHKGKEQWYEFTGQISWNSGGSKPSEQDSDQDGDYHYDTSTKNLYKYEPCKVRREVLPEKCEIDLYSDSCYCKNDDKSCAYTHQDMGSCTPPENNDPERDSTERVSFPSGVAFDSKGRMYVSDLGNNRVIRIDKEKDSDGNEKIVPVEVVYTYESNDRDKKGNKVTYYLSAARGIAFNSKDELYIADSDKRQIVKKIGGNSTETVWEGFRKIKRTKSPTLKVIVNDEDDPEKREGTAGDGGEAKDAQLMMPMYIEFDDEDNLYIVDSAIGYQSFRKEGDKLERTHETGDSENDDFYVKEAKVSHSNRIRMVEGGTSDGIITLMAGTGLEEYNGEGHLVRTTNLPMPMGLTVGPDKAIYVSVRDKKKGAKLLKIHHRIPKSEENKKYYAFPKIMPREISVPSEDGNMMYIFDEKGRHDRTVDLVFNRLKYKFEYGEYSTNTKNQKVYYLTKVIECDKQTPVGNDETPTCSGKNETTIERGGDGAPTAIIAPNKLETKLTPRTTPVGDTPHDRAGYDLAAITLPGEVTHKYLYEDGLLSMYTNPDDKFDFFDYDDGRLSGITSTIEASIVSNRKFQFFERSGVWNNYTVTYKAKTFNSRVRTRTETWNVKIAANGDRTVKHTNAAGRDTLVAENYHRKKKERDDGTTAEWLEKKNVVKIHPNGNNDVIFFRNHPDSRIGSMVQILDRRVHTIKNSTKDRKYDYSLKSVKFFIDDRGHVTNRKFVMERNGKEYTDSFSLLDEVWTHIKDTPVAKVTSTFENNGNIKSKKMKSKLYPDFHPIEYKFNNGLLSEKIHGTRKVIYQRNNSRREIDGITLLDDTVLIPRDDAGNIKSATHGNLATLLGISKAGVLKSVGNTNYKWQDSKLSHTSADKIVVVNTFNGDGEIGAIETKTGNTKFEYDDQSHLIAKKTSNPSDDISFYYSSEQGCEYSDENTIALDSTNPFKQLETWTGDIDAKIYKNFDDEFTLKQLTLLNYKKSDKSAQSSIFYYFHDPKGRLIRAKDQRMSHLKLTTESTLTNGICANDEQLAPCETTDETVVVKSKTEMSKYGELDKLETTISTYYDPLFKGDYSKRNGLGKLEQITETTIDITENDEGKEVEELVTKEKSYTYDSVGRLATEVQFYYSLKIH